MKKEAKKETPPKSGENSFGVAAVVLGILSIMFASVNGLIFGIIGLIFAKKQQSRSPNSWGKNGKTLAIIGIILSIVIIIVLLIKPELLSLQQYNAIA